MVEKAIEALKSRLERLRVEKRALRGRIAELQKGQKRLERDLRDARNLLKGLPGAVVLIQGRKITFVNEFVCEMLGYDENEILNHSFLEYVHPEFRNEVRERYQKRLSGKPVPNRYETGLQSKSGETLWCEVRVRRILLRGRRAMLLNLIGLNERKELERQLARTQKRDALARMSRGLHHELAAWLNFLQNEPEEAGAGEVVQRDRLPESPDGVRAPFGTAPRLSRQLECLGETEQDRGEEISYDLRKVVQEVVAHARNRWSASSEKGKGIQIKSYLRTLSPLVGRPEEIKSALSGLVENAVEALTDGGNVYLTTEESEGFAHVYIQDNGTGVSPDLEEKIYDPFFTTRGESKKGLGLSLALAAVRRQGGEIDLKSVEGGGTACIIRLPLPKHNPCENRAAIRKRIRDARILVVSEQEILRDLLCRLLLNKGCQVDSALTIGEALRLLPRKAYNLLVADREGTDRSITGFLKKIREMKPGMSVVLVNSPGNGRSSKRMRNTHADLVIERPLDMDRMQTLFIDLLIGRDSVP